MQSRRAVRLALALALTLASVGFAGGTLAASVTGTIRLDPPTSQVANGGTVNITVISNTSVPISGLAASITFDKAILQVTSITRAPAWAHAPLFIAGDASAIATANKKGVLQAVGVSFFPPTSVPAGDQQFITVAFKAVACGTVTMTMPTGRVDSGLLDGRASTYGNAVSIKTTGATVTVCQGAAGASGSPAASGSAGPGDSGSAAPSDFGSAAPSASEGSQASAAASAAPSDNSGLALGAGGGTGSGGTTSEQNSWLTFALAALAVSAAGLALLILVLTIVAISAAVVGAIVLMRYWRRTTENDRATASAAANATSQSAPATPDAAPDATAPSDGDAHPAGDKPVAAPGQPQASVS